MAESERYPLDYPEVLRNVLIGNITIGNRLIGTGASGRIREAKWEGIVVAVKEIHSVFTNEVSDLEFQSFKKSFLRECEHTSRLRHPNIVRFFGIYHPPGAKVPSLVMERLHCSLAKLLKSNPVHKVPIGTKVWIIKDVALGLRYLHTRNPSIIHRDLSSNNVLLSRGMEGKIGDLGTARLVDSTRQSKMTKAPGTVDFMPPEALEAVTNICYDKEQDVFSFGCVMLHTLSHEWPTPSQAVIINPDTGLVSGGRSEVVRRGIYFEKIDRSRSDVLIPLIESCLSNLPKNRPSIVSVCDQLKDQLVDNKRTSLEEETQQKDAEIQRICTEITELQSTCQDLQRKSSDLQRRDTEIQQLTTTLHEKDKMLQELITNTSKLQIPTSQSLPKKVSESSSDFWSSLESTMTWKPCADLPSKYWITAAAELNGKVYVAIKDNKGGYVEPLMYDSNEDKWSSLPALPYAHFSLVTIPDRKQLLAIGGMIDKNKAIEITSKVFLWDEENWKWTTPYPNMPTARYDCSSISHGSAVIVAGGVTCHDPWIMTRAVEVLHILESGWFTKSYWSVVEQLPHVAYLAIPLIISDKLYIAVGCDTALGHTTCNIVTASLPELLKNSHKNNSNGQVWYKLPDLPYSTNSINHYGGRVVAFGGSYRVEQPNTDRPAYNSIPLIHIYNTNTNMWDCVGVIPSAYSLGRSVYIGDNKILFVGGLTCMYHAEKNDDIATTCYKLMLT